jgi:HTH-type transcriptional regulator, sugar sensing transcriptional regulator
MNEIMFALKDAGFSKVEIDTYLCILSNGPISVGKISKITHNYRPNIYQAIERLKSRGFISESNGKNSKLYEALSPKNLLEEINRKKEAIERVMPLLKSMKSTSIITTSMRVIEGLHGWKHLLNDFLEIGKERVVYGIPKEAQALIEFFNEYHKIRAKRKLNLRHLFNYDARERLSFTNKLPYTESRYLPRELDQPVSTSICGSLIAITVYENNNILTIVIDNQKIANAYKKYFEFLWKIAKK